MATTSARTDLGYLSGLQNSITRLPDDDSVSAREKEFFANLKKKAKFIYEIRRNMKIQMIRHCIQEGIPIIVKPKSCTRSDLINVIEKLYETEGIYNKPMHAYYSIHT